MVNVNDRRYLETEQKIRATFIDLLTVGNFGKMTVSQLVQRAGIRKATFYTHYQDKYDLANQLFDEQLKQYSYLLKKRIEFSTEQSDQTKVQALFEQLQPIIAKLALLAEIHDDELRFGEKIKTFCIQILKRNIDPQFLSQLAVPERTLDLIATLMLELPRIYTHQEITQRIADQQFRDLNELIRFLLLP